MTYVLTAIIAILAWQLITTIVYFVSGEKEETVAITGMGLWAGLIMLLGIIVRSIKLACSRKYNLYQFYGECTQAKEYTGWIGNFYMTPKVASKFRAFTEEEPAYSIKLLRTGSEFKSAPHEREIITEEKLCNGFSTMSKDFIAKFLKED